MPLRLHDNLKCQIELNVPGGRFAFCLLRPFFRSVIGRQHVGHGDYAFAYVILACMILLAAYIVILI